MSTKNYLVTHSEANTSASPVAQILGISAEHIKNGVNLMATDATPAVTDILEFPSLGITSAHLTEEQVKKLRASKGIMAVEEDLPMHILEVANYVAEDGTAQDIDSLPRHLDDFQQGYAEGMQHIINSMTGGRTSVNPTQPVASAAQGLPLESFRDRMAGMPVVNPQQFPIVLPFQPIP